MTRLVYDTVNCGQPLQVSFEGVVGDSHHWSDGSYLLCREDSLFDLFMAPPPPVKKYVNLYWDKRHSSLQIGCTFETEEKATSGADRSFGNEILLKTVEVEVPA